MLLVQESVLFFRRVLWIVFLLSLAGVAFSGTLTYQELFGTAAGCSLSGGGAISLLDLPVCVYGLAMYSTLAVVSGWALFRSR
jgi:hypothetical protein